MEPVRQRESILPKDFDVEAPSNASDETQNTVYAGTVEAWERLELSEKAKARPYITGIVVSTWTVSVIICVLRVLITGNLMFTIPQALFTVPLYIVLRFYFRSG